MFYCIYGRKTVLVWSDYIDLKCIMIIIILGLSYVLLSKRCILFFGYRML